MYCLHTRVINLRENLGEVNIFFSMLGQKEKN